MARINTIQLIDNAIQVGDLAQRVQQVQQDPAVQKAWIHAGDDITAAAKSITAAWFETRAAWLRTGPGRTHAIPQHG